MWRKAVMGASGGIMPVGAGGSRTVVFQRSSRRSSSQTFETILLSGFALIHNARPKIFQV